MIQPAFLDLPVFCARGVITLIAASAIMLASASTASANAPASDAGLYDVGGYRLYLTCSGAGSPTVILDAGLGADHSEWSAVQPAVARFTRVCSWDRAGLGKSDRRPRRGPVTTFEIAVELHTLLQQAGIKAPYILVGHSVGGIDMRIYQMRYPADVAGLVMAEGTPEQQELTGNGIESGNGEVIVFGPAAHALQHWSLSPDLPLVVIERAEDTDSVWQAQQAALSVRSGNSLLIVAMNSDHRVEEQQPALVAVGIEAVVDSVNNHNPLSQCPDAIPGLGGVCLAAGTALPMTGVTVSIVALVVGGIVVLLAGTGLGLVVGRAIPRLRTGFKKPAI